MIGLTKEYTGMTIVAVLKASFSDTTVIALANRIIAKGKKIVACE